MPTTRMVPMIAAVCCLFFAVNGLSQVRTWVSTTGSDSNPCTLQQPCRNFEAAHDAVAAGGEVVALGSGGYGPVNINKRVALIAPEGVHAAIAPTTGSAVVVNAPAENVVLRNLYLNSQGATYGISVTAAAALHVEGCVVSGFVDGVKFQPIAGRLALSNSVVRNCTGTGIDVVGGSDVRAVVSDSQLHYNLTGVRVVNARAAIRDTVSTASHFGVAFRADGGSVVTLEGCTAGGGDYGFYAYSTGVMTVVNGVASTNDLGGFYADMGGVIFVSHCLISGNSIGVSFAGGGQVRSVGNNILQGNTSNGAFTNTFFPN